MEIFALLLQTCYRTHQLVRFSARLWMVAGLVTLSCAPVSEWPVSIVGYSEISSLGLHCIPACACACACVHLPLLRHALSAHSPVTKPPFLPRTFCESRLVNGTKAFLAIHFSRAHLFTDAADRLLRSCITFLAGPAQLPGDHSLFSNYYCSTLRA